MKRPWGSMWKLIHTHKLWVKIIYVTGRTSLQYHNERTEYHISINGIKKVKPGEVHRMGRGLYLEIATGKPREEDIIRLQDDYGRIDTGR